MVDESEKVAAEKALQYMDLEAGVLPPEGKEAVTVMAEELVELGRKGYVTRWSRFEQPYLPGWSKAKSTAS